MPQKYESGEKGLSLTCPLGTPLGTAVAFEKGGDAFLVFVPAKSLWKTTDGRCSKPAGCGHGRCLPFSSKHCCVIWRGRVESAFHAWWEARYTQAADHSVRGMRPVVPFAVPGRAKSCISTVSSSSR